jgi:hypothetical protein
MLGSMVDNSPCGHTKYAGVEPCEHSVAAALADALTVCAEWGLTAAEAEALVAGDPERAAAVIRIEDLLDRLYSDPLPRMWMTIANKNPRLGGSVDAPVRPVDHAIGSPSGLADVLELLEGYTQGK